MARINFPMLSFETFPIWVNLLVLAAGAAAVWLAGTRLEGSVAAISERTGLGSAFGGIILLAFSTSLPEVATTISGAVIGNAEMLTNNLIGGIAMQTAILAIADLRFGRSALSYSTPQFSVLLSGVSLVLLLGLTLVAMVLADPIAIGHVGMGAATLFTAHLVLVYFNFSSRDRPGWKPVMKQIKKPGKASSPPEGELEDHDPAPLSRHWLSFAICSAIILVAGWAVMMSAEAVAAQTGIAASFIGATLVAIATSLPEVSTTLAAVRAGNNEMAFANIFGSNLWCVSLLFLGDLFFQSGPLLAERSQPAMFMAALGVVVTCVYLWGLLERMDRTIGRLGIDSVVVIVLYVGGLCILYNIR